ncbi:MAG: hypothetical protein Q7V58_09440 [Actinomycetota bacterium]|nr:hypothetical protein [Actinomycetota bacterium]
MPTIDTFAAVLNGDGTGFDVTLTTTDFDTFTLTRQALDGAIGVRGAEDAALSAGAAFVSDLEAPQNTAVAYHVSCERTSDGYRATATVAATGEIDLGFDALFDLSRPTTILEVHPEKMPTWGQGIPSEFVWAQNRPDPVVISQVLRHPSGALSLLTATLAAKDEMNTALSRGNIIAFSPRYPETYGFDGLWYLAVGRVAVESLNPLVATEPGRRFVLDIQRIAPPPATFTPVDGRTWEEIVELGWTWEYIVASGMTWLQVMFS